MEDQTASARVKDDRFTTIRKVIAAINMTLDGFCDHTSGIADDELYGNYNEVLRNAGALLYGRITYELMESYWTAIVAKPTGNSATEFLKAKQVNTNKYSGVSTE